MEETLKRVEEEVEKNINNVLDKGINTVNLDHLQKLADILKNVEKTKSERSESMNYGNYNGRGPGHGSYGEYGNYGNYGEYGRENYGARGRDMRYRGDQELDRMAGEYGRYQESRGRYGAGEETNKSFHYMVEALKDFVKVLNEEAETPQQKQMLREALQQSMM